MTQITARTSFRRALIGCASALLLLATVATPRTAEAAPDAIRPGTKAFFASMAMGGAISVSNYVSQFRLRQEFGWHFQGQFAGPAIGLTIGEAFGSNVFTLNLGPKFWWDFQIMDLGLYIAPFAMVGFGLAAPSGGDASAGFNWGIGVEARLVLFDTGFVSFQPFSFDFFHGEAGTAVRYNLVFGGGFTF